MAIPYPYSYTGLALTTKKEANQMYNHISNAGYTPSNREIVAGLVVTAIISAVALVTLLARYAA